MTYLRAALALAFLCLTPGGVGAQPSPAACFTVKDAIKKAFEKFHETPEFVFATGEGVVFTMTVDRDSGNWTIFVQTKDDQMCVVATGANFGPAPDAIKALALPGEGA